MSCTLSTVLTVIVVNQDCVEMPRDLMSMTIEVGRAYVRYVMCIICIHSTLRIAIPELETEVRGNTDEWDVDHVCMSSDTIGGPVWVYKERNEALELLYPGMSVRKVRHII